MISLLLIGGAAILIAIFHFYRRARRAKTNAFERFIQTQKIDVADSEHRTIKLLKATAEQRRRKEEGQTTSGAAGVP